MAVIFLETTPKGKLFELQRTLYIGYYAKNDWIEEFTFDDRLRAAIYNFGIAANFLNENYKERHIAIISDNDGRDIQYNGEHNTLYSLLFPYSDLEARKYAGLYSEYIKWLHRAKELIEIGKIEVRLIDAVGDDELIIRFYKGDRVKEMNKKPSNHHVPKKKLWI